MKYKVLIIYIFLNTLILPRMLIAKNADTSTKLINQLADKNDFNYFSEMEEMLNNDKEVIFAIKVKIDSTKSIMEKIKLIQALGFIESSKTISILHDLYLDNPNNKFMKISIIKAFEEIKNNKNINFLLKQLEQETDCDIKKVIIYVLGSNGNELSKAKLIKLYAKENNIDVKVYIALALAKNNNEIGRKLAKKIISHYKEYSPDLLNCSCLILGLIGDVEDNKEVENYAKKIKTINLKRGIEMSQMEFSLRNKKETERLILLKKYLNDIKNPMVVQAAIKHLMKITNNQATKILSEKVEHSYGFDKLKIIRELKKRNSRMKSE